MKLPEEAKRLIKAEARNLAAIRQRLRHFFMGSVAGGALQILRLKRELEEILTKEFIQVRILGRQEGKKRIPIVSFIPDYTDLDTISASLAASSFANSWAAAAISNSSFNTDFRIRRTVATETARAYSDVIREAAGNHKLIRVWNAVLDTKTCGTCRDMDGETTLPGTAFRGNMEPGWVHINCRCYSELILK